MKNDKELEDGQMQVTIEVNGEFVVTSVPIGATVQALFDEGHLRGIEVGSVRIGGKPVKPDTVVKEGETVQAVPSSGKLA